MPAEETSSALQIGEWIVHPALDCISRGTRDSKTRTASDATAPVPGGLRRRRRQRRSSARRGVAGCRGGIRVRLSGSVAIAQDSRRCRSESHLYRDGSTQRLSAHCISAACDRTRPHIPQAPVLPRRTAAPRRVWIVAGAFVALALAAAYFLGRQGMALKAHHR